VNIDDDTDLFALPAVRRAVGLAAVRCRPLLETEDAAQEAWSWLATPAGRRRVQHALLPDGTIYVRQLAADIYHRRLMTVLRREQGWREHTTELNDWAT